MAEEFVQTIKLKVDDSDLVAAVKRFRDALGESGNVSVRPTAGLEKGMKAVGKEADEAARKVEKVGKDLGEAGAKAGLSAAKWMRMAKVSKPTATRDLADLAQSGAIVPTGDGPQTRYRLNHPAFEPDREPMDDGINDGINAALLRLVLHHPGRRVPFFLASVKASRATVERAVRALVRAGRIEHRGSRKTGGYFAKSPAS